MSATPDPIPLAQKLIRRPSVTPVDAGVMDVLEGALRSLGFLCERLPFGPVDNLYARLGAAGRNFCFAGHLDVVPVGDESAWSFAPFGGELIDGWLTGRGAADMKGAIAAMVSGVETFLAVRPQFGESISLLMTLDEEGPSVDGTVKALQALRERGERLDACLVGEPTSTEALADTVKNGRRGSLNAAISVLGAQGHVAYPKKAANPVSPLLDLLQALRTRMLDAGAPGFEASNLEVTTLDVANPSHNVIPARAAAKFNIRFNTRHSGAELLEWIEQCRFRVARFHPKVDLRIEARVTGEPFYTPPGDLTDLVCVAAEAVTGRAPVLSTSGGTSDARFIKDYCPVVELGLSNATAHMVDERVRADDVRALAQIYAGVLARYFPEPEAAGEAAGDWEATRDA